MTLLFLLKMKGVDFPFMNNIRQLTNFDVKDFDDIPMDIPVFPIEIDSTGKEIKTNYPYKIIDFEAPIFKMGYCSEVKGLSYPIFLKMTGKDEEERILLGKTGMFEFQTENWNNDEDKPIEITVTQIKVPKDIKFVLDYCYSL